MEFSKRMDRLGEGVFTTLLDIKNARFNAGLPVADFSVGTPNIPPAPHIIETLTSEAAKPENYIYAISDISELRQAVSDWYMRRYGVNIDPACQVCSLLGSQEGLGHIALAFADEGDDVLVPDPCYPIFGAGALIAGATMHYMQQKPENGYIIDLHDIPETVAKRAKLMIVSYPNNPTTAIAPASFYRDLIKFAKDYDIAVLHDNAYSELVFDGENGGSFLSFPGAMDVGVEFNSLSKSYGLAGARVGFCIGNSEIVKSLKTLKSNMDYGMFIPVQKAAIAALNGPQEAVNIARSAYERRRNILCDGLTEIGWQVKRCAATMFVWAKIPSGFESSQAFCRELVERTGVLFTPGDAFGPAGEGFVRIALVQSDNTVTAAIKAIKESGILG